MLTFALGVAGSTLVLGLLDQAFVRPLGFAGGRELVTLYVTSGPEYSPMPYADYAELRTALDDTVDLAAFCRVFMTVAGGAFPERHEGEMVSGAFFSVLGVRPALGRLVGPADNLVPGGRRVVVLSDFLWRSQFAADPEIVGRTVRLNEDVYDVIGVAPAGFRGAVWPSFESAFWIPAMMADDYFSRRDVLSGRAFAVFQTVGRLAPGTPLEAVQARIDPVDEVLARDRGASVYYPETGTPWRVQALPASYLRLWPGVPRRKWPISWAFSASWRRPPSRRRARTWRRCCWPDRPSGGTSSSSVAPWEPGASTWCVGSAWRSPCSRRPGGLGAAVLVVWSSAFAPLLPLTVPYQLDLVPDLRVLGIGLAVTAGDRMRLRSPRRLAGPSRPARLRGDVPHPQRRRPDSTAMSGLVVAQVAVSTVLVVGCGLLARSAGNTQRIDQGFDAPYGASLRVAFPRAWEDDPDLADAAMETGSSTACAPRAWSPPRAPRPAARETFRFGWRCGSPTRGGWDRRPPSRRPSTRSPATTSRPSASRCVPGGCSAGRTRRPAPRVAVVSQTLAALHFPPRDPVGRTLRLPGEEGPRRIVAVVADTAGRDVRLAPPATVYVPYRQRAQGSAYVTVRAAGGAADEGALLRRRARELDPAIALSEAATFTELRRAATRESRVHAGLGRDRRRARPGPRPGGALRPDGLHGPPAGGAKWGSASRWARRGPTSTASSSDAACRLTVLGLVPGLAASIGAGRRLSPLLYGVGPGDAPTFAVVPALFLAAAVVACLGPALHATRVNPNEVLRDE